MFCKILVIYLSNQPPVTDGHVAPADITNAMAAGARQLGAEIYRRTRVMDIKLLPSGEWNVITDKGNITCQHVVNSAGSIGPTALSGQSRHEIGKSYMGRDMFARGSASWNVATSVPGSNRSVAGVTTGDTE
mgnify:CR=1 FL=1